MMARQPMTSDLDIYRSANEFVKLHGLGAVIRIPKYARELMKNSE